VLDNGSVLTKANTIDGGGFDFNWANVSSYVIATSAYPDGLFKIDNVGGITQIGDFAGDNNLTQISIQDATAKQ